LKLERKKKVIEIYIPVKVVR